MGGPGPCLGSQRRFFLLRCCASASPPSAPRLAAEPAAKRPRLGVQRGEPQHQRLRPGPEAAP